MKKILSCFLSISVFLSCVPPVQGQRLQEPVFDESWKVNTGFEVLPSDTASWSERFQKKLEVLDAQLQKEAESAEEKLVRQGEKIAQQECSVAGLQCISDMAFDALRKANWKQENGQVCDDKQVCVPLIAFAQGGIRWALQDLLYYEGKLIVETADIFTGLVVTYGVSSEEDRKKALNYFYALADQAHSDCGKSVMEFGSASRRADARQATSRYADRCGKELASLYGMAMLSKTTQENQNAINAISSLLNDKYDSSAAGAVIPAAATALATIGTAGAYNELYAFLMDESIPSTAGNLANISLKSGAENALRVSSNLRGGNSRYLNRINEQFQYLDQEESGRQGFDNTAFRHEKRQYPYGNILEDVGRLIGEESATNQNAANIAKNIINQANNYVQKGSSDGKDLSWMPGSVNAAGNIHYPVVLGILDGWRTHGKKFIYAPSQELLTLFYKGDWWDINEGTQQRVHYIAWRFAKKRGYSWDKPSKDKDKEDRYVYNARILEVAGSADVAVMPILMTQLVASLPAMARSLASSVRWLQANKKFIGYRFTSGGRSAAAATKQASASGTVARGGRGTALPRVSASSRGSVPASTPTAVPVKKTPAKAPVAAQAPASAPEMVNLPLTKGKTAEPTLSSVSKAEMEKSLFGPLEQKIQQARIAQGDMDADLARFMDGKPLIAKSLDQAPKSGGFFSKLFKSKTQKILDGVSKDLAALPQEPAARMQKLQELSQRLSLDQATVSKATQEELRMLTNLKWKVSSQIRAAQAPAKPGIAIVQRSAAPGKPGVEIVKRPAVAPAASAPAPTPARKASAPVHQITLSGTGQGGGQTMRVGDVLDGQKVLGGADDAVAAARTERRVAGTVQPREMNATATVAEKPAPAAEKTLTVQQTPAPVAAVQPASAPIVQTAQESQKMAEITRVETFVDGAAHYTRYSPDRVKVFFKDGTTKVLPRDEMLKVVGKSSAEVKTQWLQAEQADLVRGATSFSRDAETGAVTLQYGKAGRVGKRVLSSDEYAKLRSGMQEPTLTAFEDLEMRFLYEVDSNARRIVSSQKSARLRELVGSMKNAKTSGAKQIVREEALPIIEDLKAHNALTHSDYLYLKLFFNRG